MKKIIYILLTFVTLNATANSPIGIWSGKLEINPTMSLRLLIDISQSGEEYNSTLISLDQNNAVIAASSTTVTNDSISLNFPSIGASFKAQIGDTTLRGIFIQTKKGYPLTLTLKNDTEDNDTQNRPQNPKTPYPYNQKEVAFTNRIQGNKLSGTLSIPASGKAEKAVVLVSGSGAQNRDYEVFEHKPFLVLADYLTRQGIAVLRYDDRGVGKSEKVDSTTTTLDLAYDAEAAVQYLRTNGGFDKIGVIGHSEGGMIALILAGMEEYIKPDFVISMAAPGLRGDKTLLYQQEIALKELKLSEDTIKQKLELNQAIYSKVIKSKEINVKLENAIEKVLEDYSTKFDSTITKDNIQKIIQTVTDPQMYFFIKFDPKKTIRNIECDVLAINGNSDSQVHSQTNLKSIAQELMKGGNIYFQIKGYDGLNHLFQKCNTGSIKEYSQISETFNPQVMEDITTWIKKLIVKKLDVKIF